MRRSLLYGEKVGGKAQPFRTERAEAASLHRVPPKGSSNTVHPGLDWPQSATRKFLL